jgi:hypothetical protein
LLQRQCSCGKHTIAGGVCEECQQKGETASQNALDEIGQVTPPDIQTTRDSTARFNLSHVPAQTRFTANGQPTQPALTVNAPGDQYEQEADHVAETVMRMPDPALSSTKINGFSPPTVSRLPAISRIQASGGNGAFQAPTSVETRINQMQNGGQALPAEEQNFFEERMGYDFSHVRIHTDANAVQASRDIHAHAFTIGNNIAFNAGAYQPGIEAGRRLLAHELTHVVQQSHNVQEKPVQRLVNPARVSCNRYPRTYPIFRAIGTDDPVGALQAADARAIELLSNTIDWLTSTRVRIQAGEPPGWPTVNDCMAQSMRTRLLINPDDPNSWMRRGPGTVERIIRMLTNLRGVFQGGYIRYSCLDRSCESGDDAFVQDGEGYLLHLCRGFWGMDDDYRAIVLIHELAHIYYNTEDRGFLGLGSSYCIEGFLNDLNEINVPAIYQSDCRGDQVDAC